MQGQITKTYKRVVGRLEEGLKLLDRLAAVNGYKGEKKEDREAKGEALKEAAEWLEDYGLLMCNVSQDALQYPKPSAKLLALVEKTLSVGASMTAVADRFQLKVVPAWNTGNWKNIDIDLNDVRFMWIQFELLRTVLFNAGLRVPTRKVRWP